MNNFKFRGAIVIVCCLALSLHVSHDEGVAQELSNTDGNIFASVQQGPKSQRTLSGTQATPIRPVARTIHRMAAQSASTSAGWIGMMLENHDGQGAKVTAIFPGGPAAMAGLRVEDVVEGVDGSKVSTAEAAISKIEGLKPGSKAKITVLRHGMRLELKTTTGDLKEFHENYIREMMSRDPRDPNYAQFHGISDKDISIEVTRRLFDQNQRLETLLHDVLDEVQALRMEVGALRANRSN